MGHQEKSPVNEILHYIFTISITNFIRNIVVIIWHLIQMKTHYLRVKGRHFFSVGCDHFNPVDAINLFHYSVCFILVEG